MMLTFIKNLFKKPESIIRLNKCPDPCTIQDIRDFLFWSGVDELSFMRQADDTVHLLVRDGDVYHNTTYWPDKEQPEPAKTHTISRPKEPARNNKKKKRE